MRLAVAREAMTAGLLLAPLLLLLAHAGGIDWQLAGLLWLLLLALVIPAAIRHAASDRFGPANALTLLRFGLVLLLLQSAIAGGPVPSLWSFTLALAALLLDAADGWSARRFACASRFGARFDMETDTLFLFTLAFLLFVSGRAGLWVLLAGLLRPLFLLAARLHPPLAAPLAPSRRRAGVCGLAASLLTLA